MKRKIYAIISATLVAGGLVFALVDGLKAPLGESNSALKAAPTHSLALKAAPTKALALKAAPTKNAA